MDSRLPRKSPTLHQMGKDKTTASVIPIPACRLVLASEDPRHLAGFYGHLLNCGPGVATAGQAVTLRLPMGMALVLYRPSRQRPQPRKGGSLAFCLCCSDLEGMSRRAIALGAQLSGSGRKEAFGREQWLLDPEGNRFLVWEAPQAASDAGLDSNHEH